MNHSFLEVAPNITFVRHGESTANAGGVTVNHALIPLSSLGHAQSVRVAELLPNNPSQVLVSPYVRARDTAQAYCLRVGREAHIHPLLQEFSALDPALLEGMTGEQRRPIADAYWHAADPTIRRGVNADTFIEFDARVAEFMIELPRLPAGCVLFGHGIWFSLLWWKLQGFGARDSQAMKAFLNFRRHFPMPNCAVYGLSERGDGRWNLIPNRRAMHEIAAVRAGGPAA